MLVEMAQNQGWVEQRSALHGRDYTGGKAQKQRQEGMKQRSALHGSDHVYVGLRFERNFEHIFILGVRAIRIGRASRALALPHF